MLSRSQLHLCTLVASTGWIFSVFVTDARTMSGAADYTEMVFQYIHNHTLIPRPLPFPAFERV